MSSPQARYAACPADARRILRVLSVVCEPVNQTTLQQVLDALGWTTTRKQPLSRLLDKTLRERLIDQSLIEQRSNALCVHPDLLEPLTRATVADGTFAAIVAAAERIVPTRARSAWDRPDEARKQRMLRNALYAGREEEVLHLLGLDSIRSAREVRYAQVEPLVRVCTRSPDLKWFGALGARIKTLALAPLLTEAALELVARPGSYQLMEQTLAPLAATHADAAEALAEQRLLRARLDLVGPLLEGRDDREALVLTGWLRFVQGRYDEAIDTFEHALAAQRKATRKRSGYIPGIPGALHLLALLHRGRPADLEQVSGQVSVCLHASVTDRIQPVFRLLGDLAAVLAGQRRVAEGAWLIHGQATRGAYPALFQCLALKWLGKRPSTEAIDALTTYTRAAIEAELHWYAHEASALLHDFGPLDAPSSEHLPAPGEPPPGMVPITDLLSPRPSWELALDALKGLAQPTQRPAVATEGATARRMTWLLALDEGLCTLEPREQRRTKRGGWTQGRAVALQRLAEHPEDFPHLTEQDRRLCASITRQQESGWYGGYGRTSYQLNMDRALLAAVGHPLLFRSVGADNPVELTTGGPTLAVVRRASDILVSIEPFPREARGILAMEETPQRIRLVQFDAGHRRIAEILGADGLSVPHGGEERLLASIAAVAPMLTVHSDIGGGDSLSETVIANRRPHVHLSPTDTGLSMGLYVHPFGDGGPQLHPGEGRATLFTEVDGRAVRTTRNLDDELTGARTVLEQCPALDLSDDWSWYLDDPEQALNALEQLQAMGDAVMLDWPEGRRIGLSKEAQLGQMLVSVRQHGDWLELEGGLRLDDGRVLVMRELLELSAASKGRFVRLGNDEYLVLSKALRHRLDELRGVTEQGRFHPLAASAIEVAIDGMELEAGEAWTGLLTRLEEVRDLEPALPSTLQAELRDYQTEGFRWLARLAHWGAGACLADDMGLGKTVQALGLILSRAPAGPTLVLAPMSVCGNWVEEAGRFAPTLRPKRFGPGDRAAAIDEAGPFDLIVCSYGLLQSEGKRLAGRHWETIVADEAQAFKNPTTKRSQAIMRLKGGFKMITTGTPIENHLGELWNLFRFINPGLLGAQETFSERFAIPIEQQHDAGARQRLRRLLRPFILRRLKSDVLSELPPRTEITLHLELSEGEAALYEAIRRQALERLAAKPDGHPGQQRMLLLAEITRLRRAVCHPRLALPESDLPSSKLDAFAEIVDELLDNRHKALVFSQFVDHLRLIRAHLDQRGVRYQYLDGATPETQRRAAVDAFQAGEGDLFLISLRAGGAGLNLTAADYVIHMDPWWNPAVEDQASDRAHRIGQQRPVTVYRLVAKGTIEERIVKLHASKRDLADGLLAGTEDGGRLSYADMLALVRDTG